jgi:hypothetical protein
MSSPVNTQIVLLRRHIPVLVGSIIALNTPVQFGDVESLTPRGPLSISAYQSGLSAVTAVLECSIDQGVSWFSIPATALSLCASRVAQVILCADSRSSP